MQGLRSFLRRAGRTRSRERFFPNDGREAMVFVSGTATNSEGMEEYWVLAKGRIALPFSPGQRIELGDLALDREPVLPQGMVGIRFDTESQVTVEAVVPGSPAERAGLEPGDVVVEVNGVAVRDWQEAVKLIPGDPGTAVRLKIRRGADFRLLDIVRFAR